MLLSSVPVRFTEEVMGRLKNVSDRSGISVSQLVRIATEQYLQQIEQAGEIVLPLGAEDRVAELNDGPLSSSAGPKAIAEAVAVSGTAAEQVIGPKQPIDAPIVDKSPRARTYPPHKRTRRSVQDPAPSTPSSSQPS